MRKETKKAPTIRFQGFTDDWEQRKLGELSDKVTTKNIRRQYVETLTNSAEYGIIGQKDYFDHNISNMENIDGYYIVENNDFIYNPRISTLAPFGPINRNKLGRAGIISPLYTVFKPHDVDVCYLEYFFKSTYWHKFMYFNGDTGARADRFSIKDTSFFNMPISTPSIDEQKKIGDYFADLDNLITLHQRKLDQLKTLKKYFLQNMFPAKGEKVPRIRFKGFTGDWEQHKLSDLVEKICVGFVGTCEKYYTNAADGIPMYRTGDLSGFTLNHTGIKYVTRAFHKKNKKSQLKYGDILIARHGDSGKAIVYDRNEEANCLNIVIIRPNSARCNGKFLAQRINTFSVSHKIKKIAAGSTQIVINTTDIEKLILQIPKNLNEQAKIVSCFISIDNLITFHQQKLNQLQMMKKFMLQNLFI